jgi:hypothetical protein
LPVVSSHAGPPDPARDARRQSRGLLEEPEHGLTGPIEVVVRPAVLPASSVPARQLIGLCADLGSAPSAAEIDQARREMWAGFPRDGI